MRASTTDDNAAFADSDKSNVKIYFLTVPNYPCVVCDIDFCIMLSNTLDLRSILEIFFSIRL